MSVAVREGLDPTTTSRNRRLGLRLGVFAAFMFLVMTPVFYVVGDWICEYVGIGVNPDKGDKDAGVAAGRRVKVSFVASWDDALRGSVLFEPAERIQHMTVGEATGNSFRLKNVSGRTLHLRPIHNVSPAQANRKFLMTQCFCYNDMSLAPGEERILEVVYNFQTDMDVRVREALLTYHLEPIRPDEMRPVKTPEEGLR